MLLRRVVGALLLLVLALAAHADTLAARIIPGDRLRDWNTIKQEVTETSIIQEWKKPAERLPKGTTGYLLVSYHVERKDTVADAEDQARYILQKRRLNDYASRGYAVGLTPWAGIGEAGAIFTVDGKQYSMEGAQLNHADLYTVSLAREEWVVWLEVRRMAGAPTQKELDKVLRTMDVGAMAQDFANLTITLWGTVPGQAQATPGTTALPDGVVPVTPVDPVSPVTPVAPVSPIAPATPVTPADPVKPVASDPVPVPAVTPEAPLPAGSTRWQPKGGGLTLVLPAGCHMAGETPYTISGLGAVVASVFPAEAYRSDRDLTRMVEGFAATQQAVSLRDFTLQSFQVDGAAGVQVRYVNYDKRTTYAYYFGKGGRLWRIEFDVPGEGAALPEVASAILAGVTVN